MDTQICPKCNRIGAISTKQKPYKEKHFDCRKKQWVEKTNQARKFVCGNCGHKFKTVREN
jgi:transcription elongation factor Elf1